MPPTDACPVQSDLRSRFRSAFLRDCSVCFHNGIVESPTGNRAHTIETGEDAQELVNLGCDIAQGFIFGKPMTDRKLMTMVTAGRAQSQNFIGAAV